MRLRRLFAKQGFTLLELIIVIIIVGVLATLGVTQYTKVTEQGRTAEPKAILSTARSLELAYYMEKGTYATSYSDLGVGVPTSCTSTHYFQYDMAMDVGNERVRSLRCLSGGKTPNAIRAYWVILRLDGTHYSIWQDDSTPTGYW